MSSLFSSIPEGPADPILGLNAAFNAGSLEDFTFLKMLLFFFVRFSS